MKYSVLHVVPGFHSGDMVSQVIGFYDRYFPEGHSFCLYSHTQVEPNQFNPSVTIEQRIVSINARQIGECIAFIRYLNRYDIVAIHYMSLSLRLQLIMLFFFRSMFKKMVWIEWGGDLYEYPRFFNESKIRIFVYEQFCRSIGSFVAIFEPDIAVYRRHFGNKNRVFCAPYSGIGNQDDTLRQRATLNFPSFRDDGRRRVLICHRCYTLTDPIGAIDALSSFSNDNICLVIPCGGGDPCYTEKAIEHARSVFGSKVELIADYLSLPNLVALLESVDVLVINSKRQIALGTLWLACLARTKIILSKEGVMYEHFRSLGIPVSAVEEIPTMNYDEFIAPVDMDEAVKYAKDVMNLEKSASRWKAIYDEIAKSTMSEQCGKDKE